MATKTEAQRAIDTRGIAGGAEAFTPTGVSVRPGLPVPAVPQDFAVQSNVTIRSGAAPKALVTFAWSAVQGGLVNRFALQVARDSGFTTDLQTYIASGTSAAISLPSGITCYARIRAEADSGSSAWSAAVTFVTAADATVPAALAGITWTWSASGDLLIAWTLPSDGVTRIVQADIYDSAAKTTLYRSLQGASSVLWTAAMHRTDTGGTPDTAVYVELRPISWQAVYGSVQTPSPQPTLAAPATPTGLSHSWSGDTGTAGADLLVYWSTAADVAYYKITLDSVTVTVVGQRYLLAVDQNRIQHSGTPDAVITIALVAYNGLDQPSTAATATATNAAPAAPASVAVIAVPGGIFASVVATPPADFLAYRYRIIQTAPSAADVTIDNPAKVMQQTLVTAATYQVGVKMVDQFGQAGTETLSSATSLDLTIGALRAEVAYLDSLSTTPATLKAALADDNRTSGGISYTSNASYRWIRAERALLDRYRFLTIAMNQVSGATSWYVRLSSDGSAWSYFAGPVTSSRILTAVASQAAAQAAPVSLATLGASSADRVELPSSVEARYAELWFLNSTGTTRVDEYYPRRLVEADDIRAQNLSSITANLGSITAGSIDGVTITGGTVQTAASGARVVMTSTGLKTYDSGGTVQVEATTATDGTLTAGAGNVLVDADGLRIVSTTSGGSTNYNQFRYVTSAGVAIYQQQAELEPSTPEYNMRELLSNPNSGGTSRWLSTVNVVGSGRSAVTDILVGSGGYMDFRLTDTAVNFIRIANNLITLSAANLLVSGAASVGTGSAPTATLDVARGTASSGTAMFRGTTYISHINYSTDEHTYLRAGKSGSSVFLNDTHAGPVIAGGSPFGNGQKLNVLAAANLGGTAGDANTVALFSTPMASGNHVGIGVRPYRVATGTDYSTTTVLLQRITDTTWQYPYLSFGPSGLGLNLVNPTYNLQLGADSAAKPGTSTWTVVSDARTKHMDRVRPFTGSFDVLDAAQPVWFEYNGVAGTPTDGAEYVGLIAQRAPDILRRTARGRLHPDDAEETDIQYTSIDPMIWALRNAVIALRDDLATLRHTGETDAD